MKQATQALLAISLLAGAVAPWPAMAGPARKFSIQNGSERAAVEKLWRTPSGDSEPWEEIKLSYAIKPGETSPFTMADGNICLYDIKVQFSDQYVRQYKNVNVCRGDSVTVS